MTHVSRKPMKSKVSKRLEKELLAALELAFHSKQSKPLLQLLLTHTEKIMLSKRLAILHMLGQNIPQAKIEKVLKVTAVTVSRYTQILKRGKNELPENKLKLKRGRRKSNEPNLYNAFGLMPPIVGPGRWDFLDRL
ncbi:MAG: Trp family transcriptional regulator [Candidatus Pacebacteria bacterium]|nr:Trp family transcriptional regulator [Candidatus Paceibacterota bacterium]